MFKRNTRTFPTVQLALLIVPLSYSFECPVQILLLTNDVCINEMKCVEHRVSIMQSVKHWLGRTWLKQKLFKPQAVNVTSRVETTLLLKESTSAKNAPFDCCARILASRSAEFTQRFSMPHFFSSPLRLYRDTHKEVRTHKKKGSDGSTRGEDEASCRALPKNPLQRFQKMRFPWDSLEFLTRERLFAAFVCRPTLYKIICSAVHLSSFTSRRMQPHWATSNRTFVFLINMMVVCQEDIKPVDELLSAICLIRVMGRGIGSD